MKREPNITEQQAREIVEKMGRRESYTPKSMDDLYRRIGLEPDEPGQPGNTAEARQQQAAQIVVGGLPRHLSPSPKDYQPQARVRQ